MYGVFVYFPGEIYVVLDLLEDRIIRELVVMWVNCGKYDTKSSWVSCVYALYYLSA